MTSIAVGVFGSRPGVYRLGSALDDLSVSNLARFAILWLSECPFCRHCGCLLHGGAVLVSRSRRRISAADRGLETSDRGASGLGTGYTLLVILRTPGC